MHTEAGEEYGLLDLVSNVRCQHVAGCDCVQFQFATLVET